MAFYGLHAFNVENAFQVYRNIVIGSPCAISTVTKQIVTYAIEENKHAGK